MDTFALKNDIVSKLQKEVLLLQGFRRSCSDQTLNTGLGPLEKAFPDCTFPTGVVHEFISYAPKDVAATNGFITGLLGNITCHNRTIAWIGTKRTIFPPALKLFGIEPEHVIFIDLDTHKQALWAVEEALKCEALSAVVGELRELSFTESRRLQLAVEQSRVTGFIHRNNPRSENTVACVSRWKISPIASVTNGLPGVGFPRWNVRLLKVRNGKPGVWQIEWGANGFLHIPQKIFSLSDLQTRKAG